MVGRGLTDEDKRALRAVAVELQDLRVVLMGLAETLVKMSDKEFLKTFNVPQTDVKESQVDRCREKLEKQFDIIEKEFGP